MIRFFCRLLIAFLILGVPIAYGQECLPPKIVANASSGNMFTPEQETVLGELTMMRMSGDVRLVKNDELARFVQSLGSRLVKNLPPTGLTYNFYLIDIPDANAFNIPGGHVFVSRKLIAFANSEDELAGVIAHELGHATVHHAAVDISEDLRKVLQITSLGDRKDVEDKYNRLLESYRTKRLSRKSGHENDQQLEADKIGLYAMTAAGYDPAAFTSFFDRLAETEGRTGSWFSDLFGNTRPDEKRLREMIKASNTIPAACRETRERLNVEVFQKWQADVVSFRGVATKEILPGLVSKRELNPRLQSDIKNLQFSDNGAYLLVQDDFAITILNREPLQVLFQINVKDTRDAFFTPDNREVVLLTEDLRFERWNIAAKTPVAIRELVLRSDCFENRLSPDGNFVACVDTRMSINLIETKSGKKIWEKKEFYALTGFEYFFWLTSAEADDDANFFRIEFSPDSKYVMYSRSNRYRYRIILDVSLVDGSEDVAVALDTATLKTVDIGGDLKKLASRPYVFLDSGRIIGMPAAMKPEESGVFAFPGGKRIAKFDFWAESIERTSNPDFLIIRPLANSRMGVFDFKRKLIAAGFDKTDAAIFSNNIAFESAAGKVVLRQFQFNETERRLDANDIGVVDIPVGQLGDLSAANISDNFNWMLLSAKSRGGLWNLSSGERKLHVRGFRDGVIANDGIAIADFEKRDEVPHSLVFLNPTANLIQPIREIDRFGSEQFGRFVMTRTNLKPPENKPKKETPASRDADREAERETRSRLRRDVRWEIKDFVQDKIVWGRDFQGGAPGYSIDTFSGRLLIYWNLAVEEGKAALKKHPELAPKAEKMGSKQGDYLIEIVDCYAQKDLGAILVETGNRSFRLSSGLSEGDWLIFFDDGGRLLAYSIKTGELRHRFFGQDAAINPAKGEIAVENFPGEISLYDLESGDLKGSVVIDGAVAFIRFNLAGNRMFVLGESQNAYVFEVEKIKPIAQ